VIGTVEEIDRSVHAYVDDRRRRGLSAFIDMPHYEYRP